MYDDIEDERSGQVGIARFAAGEHNAVRAQTLEELCAALDELIGDPDVGAIVLAARGRHFVAGADFAWLEEMRALPAADVRDQIYSAFTGAAERLYRCPKPTVAAVQGAAVTVGCELALTCDFRVVIAVAQNVARPQQGCRINPERVEPFDVQLQQVVPVRVIKIRPSFHLRQPPAKFDDSQRTAVCLRMEGLSNIGTRVPFFCSIRRVDG